MIRIRLMGLPGEVDQAARALAAAPDVRVLARSAPYLCRGGGYVRVYIDADITPAPDQDQS